MVGHGVYCNQKSSQQLNSLGMRSSNARASIGGARHSLNMSHRNPVEPTNSGQSMLGTIQCGRKTGTKLGVSDRGEWRSRGNYGVSTSVV